jgi:hypothetical protein
VSYSILGRLLQQSMHALVSCESNTLHPDADDQLPLNIMSRWFQCMCTAATFAAHLQAAGEQCLPRPGHGWTLKAAVQQTTLTPVLWQRTQRHVLLPHNALHGQFAASAATLLP